MTSPHPPTPSVAMYGPRFEAALAWACSLHFNQRRKGSGAPYITHPIAVAGILGQYGADEDQAIAGLLHDTMEDCDVDEITIQQRFGPRVARIVVACTDTTQQPKPPWRPRKEAHIAKVLTLPADIKLVMCADKLHNARSINSDRRRASVGESIWDRFSAPRDEVLWYYRSMVAALGKDWPHELHGELSHEVDGLQR